MIIQTCIQLLQMVKGSGLNKPVMSNLLLQAF